MKKNWWILMITGTLMVLLGIIAKTYFSSNLNFVCQSLITLYFACVCYWLFLQMKCKTFLVCSLLFLYLEVFHLNLIGIQINKNIINIGNLIFSILGLYYFIKEKDKIKEGFKKLF